MSEKKTVIEMMQDLCSEHGCPPGVNRFTWLDYMLNKLAKLEAERGALQKSVDQLADTLKNVHEAVCETLGIEGDDALPELVEGWAEWEYAALRKDASRWRKLMTRCWKFDVKFNKDGNPKSIAATFRETSTASDNFIEDAGRLIDDFAAIAAKEPK